MKIKKLISLLCAAAMTTSAFAGMTITASAAAPVVTLDGSTVDGWEGSAVPVVKTEEGSSDQYLEFIGGSNDGYASYTFANGDYEDMGGEYAIEFDTSITAGTGQGRLGRYTQAAFIGEPYDASLKDSRDYGGEYAQSVTDAYLPYLANGSANNWNTSSHTGEGLVSDIGLSVTSRIELFDKWLINDDGTEDLSMEQGDFQTQPAEWVRVRAVVSNGKATVTASSKSTQYLNGQEFPADAEGVNCLYLTMPRSDNNFVVPGKIDNPGPPTILIDNVKIYDDTTSLPAFSTDGLRGAAAVVTPPPAPETVAGMAPDFTLPERIDEGDVTKVDFEAEATGKIFEIGNSNTSTNPEYLPTEPYDLSGGKAHISIADRDGGDPNSYASIVDVTNGTKAVKFNGGGYATAGRGPRFYYDPDIEVGDGTAVMAFSVYLSKNAVKGKSRLWIVDSQGNAPDGAGEYAGQSLGAAPFVDNSETAPAYYKTFLACISADEENEGFAANGSDNNLIQVEPDQWHTVVLAITSGDNYRIWVDPDETGYKVDGELSAPVKRSKVSTEASGAYLPVKLPALILDNCASSSAANSTDLLDNIIAYATEDPIDSNILPNVVEGTAPTVSAHKVTVESSADGTSAVVKTDETDAFAATLIHAKYTDDELSSVKTYAVGGISADAPQTVNMAADDKISNGDKLMVWGGVETLLPYCSAVTVTNSSYVDYDIVIGNLTGGHVTASPAKAAADATVTLTVTADEGYTYKDSSLKVTKTDGTVVPTQAGSAPGTFTFTMPAENVNVTAEFDAVKYNISVDPAVTSAGGSITVEPTTAAKGDTVTLTVAAPADKVVKTVTYKTASGEAQNATLGTDGKYTFVMPAGDVTVNATFEEAQKYSITTVADPAGSATATYKVEDTALTDNKSFAGKTVTVEVSAPGRVVDSIKVQGATMAETDITSTKSFTMPAEDVTVTITTLEQTAPTYTIVGNVSDGVATVTLQGDQNYNATIAAGKATVTDVPAGTYTIVATASEGYDAPTIKVGGSETSSIIVSADVNENAFEVTAAKTKAELSSKFKAVIENETGALSEQNTAIVNQELTASLEKLAEVTDDIPTGVSYQWYKGTGDDKEIITEATSATFTPNEIGQTYTVEITAPAADANFKGSVTAETGAVVQPKLKGTLTLKVDETDSTKTSPEVGQTLTANYAKAAEGEDEVEVTYAWSAADSAEGEFTPIGDASGATYVIPNDKVGKFIKVTVSADGYEGLSATTAVVLEKNRITSGPVSFKYTVKDGHSETKEDAKYDNPAITDLTQLTTNQIQLGNKNMDKVDMEGALTVGDGKYDMNLLAFTVDAASIKNKIKKATLTFTAQCTVANKNSDIWLVRVTDESFTSGDDLANATYDDVNGKTAKTVVKAGNSNANAAQTFTLDVTSDLRTAEGKATYLLACATGREQKITDVRVTIDEAEEDLANNVSVKVKKVVDGAETENVEAEETIENLWEGDKFVYDYSEKQTIETDAGYFQFASADPENATINELSATSEDNVITLKYTKTPKYTATLTTKLSEAPKDGVQIKINGTPTVKGEPIEQQTITTEAETGQATIKLLPGSYTYAIDATDDYLATNGSFDIEAADLSVPEIVLQPNNKQRTTVNIYYTTQDKNTGVIEGKTVNGATFDVSKFVDDKITVDELLKKDYLPEIISVDNSAQKHIYKYKSGAQDTTVEGETTDIVLVYEDLGEHFDYYEDFSGVTAEDTPKAYWSNGDSKTGQDGNSKFTITPKQDAEVFDTKYISAIMNGNNGLRNLIHNLETPIELASKKVTIDFDMSVSGLSDSDTQGAEINFVSSASVGSNDDTVYRNLVSLGMYRQNGDFDLSYYAKGGCPFAGNNPTFYGSCRDIAEGAVSSDAVSALSATAISDGKFNKADGTEWYHVNIVVENNQMTIKVNTVGQEDTATVSEVAVPESVTDIQYIRLAVGKVTFSGNRVDAAATINVDNLAIQSEAAGA